MAAIRKLTIIGSSMEASRHPALAAVLGSWPSDTRPASQGLTVTQVLEDESLLDATAVAWVVLEQRETPGLYALLGCLLDRNLPVMLSRASDEPASELGMMVQEGVVLAPLAGDTGALVAMLRTLWSQSNVILGLKSEIQFLRKHEGGLCGQIEQMDEELRLAAQLQKEFLPSKMPRVANVEFRTLFRPASYVSGDIYDVIRLDEACVGFYVADAVGHGVPAALMTMFIKRCLHTKEVGAHHPRGYRIVPPDEAMSRLNRDMAQYQSATKVRFATACYAVLNCKTLELSVSRAGHPCPLVLHADGTTETISPDGAMLGIFPDEIFELKRVQLRPGDRLLLFSDGFELAFPDAPCSDPGQALTQPYEQEFERFRCGDVDEAMAVFLDRLDQQAGSLNQRDDMTAIFVALAPSRVKSDFEASQGAELEEASPQASSSHRKR